MSHVDIVKADNGRINRCILAREGHEDYLARVEAARRRIPTTFGSPKGKRLFLRYFDSSQLNSHFVSVIARTRLPHEMIEKVEASIKQDLEQRTTDLNQAIDGVEALFNANGIHADNMARYDAEPLVLEVRVISSLGRRYLELLTKIDQLMPMLETLAIDEIISQHELDFRKGLYKGHAPALAKGTRFLATNLRKRMNALAQQYASSRTPTPSAAPATAVSEEARTPPVEVAGTPLIDKALVPAAAPESMQPAQQESAAPEDSRSTSRGLTVNGPVQSTAHLSKPFEISPQCNVELCPLPWGLGHSRRGFSEPRE